MQIAICDDEQIVRDTLANMVKRLFPETELFLFSDGGKLLEADGGWDILLLDIRMPGCNGMNIAEKLRKKGEDSVIIFITALEEYVFEAFDVGAFHYLVKPFREEKLTEVLRDAMAYCRKNKSIERQLEHIRQEDRYILIKRGGVRTRVKVNDIIYAEVFNRKVTIHTTDGELEYYGKISDLEKQLGTDFFRSHRAYLVHLKYVMRYDAVSISMERGKALMSKTRFSQFVKAYLQYARRKGRSGEPWK